VEAKDMAKRKPRGIAGDKTICLPIADDIDGCDLNMMLYSQEKGETVKLYFIGV
jgi:hypothetical protein